jgi:hypothetical protein
MKQQSKAKTVKTSEDKAHATFGASGSKMWMGCPASIQESEGLPNEETPAAAEGTRGHACFEFINKSSIGLVGNVLVLNEKKLANAIKFALKKWDKAMVDHAVTTLKYLYAKFLRGVSNVQMFIEEKLDASKFTRQGEFGTADLLIINRKARKLIMLDYKYGAGYAVEVVDNSQLIYYALAALLKYGPKNFDTIELVVLQPRAHHEDGPNRHHTMTREELLAWGHKFAKAVRLALAPNPTYNPSEENCRWCRAAFKCQAIKERTMKQAAIDYSDDDEDEETAIIKVPDVSKLTHAQLSKALVACDTLEVYIEAIRKRAFQLAQDGEQVPGFKLVQKRTTRKWANPKRVERILVKHFGDKVLSTPELLSPAQVEKLIKGKEMKKFLEKETVSISSGVTLVNENDKRKAFTNRGAADYADDEEE